MRLARIPAATSWAHTVRLNPGTNTLAFGGSSPQTFTLATGDEVEYIGEASGELIEAKPLDRAAATAAIASELSRQKVEGASVRADELGVTITLENVSFQANSDALLPSEQEKLRRIASILAQYADRDLIVTGHYTLIPFSNQPGPLEQVLRFFGACLAVCPTEALDVDRESWLVSFDPGKCVACELCIPACPPHAMQTAL